jgi:predicted kinase
MNNASPPILHLICGLPGSGKSTLAEKLEQEHSALRFNPDAWIQQIGGTITDENLRANIESLQWEIAQKALSLGVDVILEFGFWLKKEREAFRKTAHQLGALTQLHFLNVPLDELKRRIALRNSALIHQTGYVNPDHFEQWAARFEIPTEEELQ